MFTVVLAITLLIHNWTTRDDNVLYFILLLASPVAAIFLAGMGVGLGLGGLIQSGSNRIFAILGLLFCSLTCSLCCLSSVYFFFAGGGGMGIG